MKLIRPRTNEIQNWTCQEMGEITHESLLNMLNDGHVESLTIVDGPTDTLVIRIHELVEQDDWKPIILKNADRVSMGKWFPHDLKLVGINEFEWTHDFSWLRTITCQNHPSAKYYTKNPFEHGLHLIKAPNGYGYGNECECNFDQLAVICNREGIALGKPADAEPVTETAIYPLPNIDDDWKRVADPAEKPGW